MRTGVVALILVLVALLATFITWFAVGATSPRPSTTCECCEHAVETTLIPDNVETPAPALQTPAPETTLTTGDAPSLGSPEATPLSYKTCCIACEADDPSDSSGKNVHKVRGAGLDNDGTVSDADHNSFCKLKFGEPYSKYTGNIPYQCIDGPGTPLLCSDVAPDAPEATFAGISPNVLTPQVCCVSCEDTDTGTSAGTVGKVAGGGLYNYVDSTGPSDSEKLAFCKYKFGSTYQVYNSEPNYDCNEGIIFNPISTAQICASTAP